MSEEIITNKDWTGNSRSCHATLGARNYAQNEREEHDFYATEPRALEELLKQEKLSPYVWECACGKGHLSEVLIRHGYCVKSSDLYDYGYGETGVDFLQCNEKWKGDILTNPPYKYGLEFVEHSLDILQDGNKSIWFLKLQFLEGKKRREFFDKYPPKTIYVSSSRLCCAMNGDFDKYSKSNAVTYAWFVWEKGFSGEPTIRWFN